MKTCCIKVENIDVPSEMKSTRVIESTTVMELFDKICKIYQFNDNVKKCLELWSAPVGHQNRKRLDVLENIPVEHEHIWVRAAITHHHL